MVDPFREAVERRIADYEAEHGPIHLVRHTVQMTSFGGSGSTAFSAHLAAAGVDLPKTPDQLPFKHQRIPPVPGEVPASFRVIYPIADPRNAMLSIFRRGFVVEHYGGLHARAPSSEVERRLANLDAFLENGIDDFELEDHVNRWMQPHGYPVLFVRYEALPGVWSAVREFVGLPDSVPCLDMRRRTSDWTELPPAKQQQLERIYGRLARRLAALPDVFVM